MTIIETQSAKGITYRNLTLRSGFSKKLQKNVQGIDPGNYIIVEKNHKEGRKNAFGMYTCGVKYNGQDVSMNLNDDEHESFRQLGDVGTKIKLTMNTKTYQAFKTADGTEIPAGVKRYPVFELA